MGCRFISGMPSAAGGPASPEEGEGGCWAKAPAVVAATMAAASNMVLIMGLLLREMAGALDRPTKTSGHAPMFHNHALLKARRRAMPMLHCIIPSLRPSCRFAIRRAATGKDRDGGDLRAAWRL
jgi:hypothetical protein